MGFTPGTCLQKQHQSKRVIFWEWDLLELEIPGNVIHGLDQRVQKLTLSKIN